MRLLSLAKLFLEDMQILTKQPGRPAKDKRPWSRSDDQYLWEHREDPSCTLARHLERSPHAIDQRLWYLKHTGYRP